MEKEDACTCYLGKRMEVTSRAEIKPSSYAERSLRQDREIPVINIAAERLIRAFVALGKSLFKLVYLGFRNKPMCYQEETKSSNFMLLVST